MSAAFPALYAASQPNIGNPAHPVLHSRMPFSPLRAIVALLSVSLLASAATPAPAPTPHRSLVLVIDGLRPDYVTPELMPRLHAFGEAGIVAEAHHSVFPTVTRVNSASIATGTYPDTHGLMHNTIYLPNASPNAIDTAEAPLLIDASAKLDGQLLTATSLGELLTQAGKKVLVTSSGSTGSAYLLNPNLLAGSTLLTNRDLIRPESFRARAIEVLGPPPAPAYPSPAGNRWAIDAFLELGLKELGADVTFMWITDPDGVAHRNAPGAPQTLEALRLVDAEFGRLLDTLQSRGLRERVNIFVTADHGFSTHGGPFNLNALLTARGLAAGVKVVGGQIYVQSGGDEKIRAIVRVLQATDWVGAIFTRAKSPGSRDGFAPGTLSHDSIHYQHARTADILVDPNWSDAKNRYGYAGTTTSGGVAGHGSSSPYDISLHLRAAGPDLKRATRSRVPTGNIDLAVTLCHLHGLTPAPAMSGRILHELLRDGPAPASLKVDRSTHRVSADTYHLELHTTTVGATAYLDYTKTTR